MNCGIGLIAALVALASAARADVVSVNPVADAFVASAQPGNNYGGAGALGVAALGLPKGEFQSVLRFDVSAVVATFDSSFGVGHWTIQSATLRLTATPPVNPLFNAQAAGQFTATWTQDDSWIEGTGMPNSPTSTGIAYSTLPNFLSNSDQPLGTFAFDGATSGSSTYTLGLPQGFVADVMGGQLVSIRLSAADSTVAYLFNSRSFSTTANRPELAITAVAAAAPASFALQSPVAGAVAMTVQTTLAWNASVGAATYRVSVTTAGGSTTTLDLAGTTTTIPMGILGECQSVVWGVTAINPAGSTPSSPPTQTFQTVRPGDFNLSGTVTVQDIFDFLNAWFAGDPRADVNGVGGITVQDIFDFLNAWFVGCP